MREEPKLKSRGELLKVGESMLAATSNTARLDAEVLLAHVLNCKRYQLLAYSEQEVSFKQEGEFQKLLARRAAGCPIAYLRGTQEFYGRDFLVNEAVLIPRPETEELVERAVKWCMTHTSALGGPLRILELGTGSGCIAISLACELTKHGLAGQFELLAVDFCEKALRVARENAVRHAVESSITFMQSDWWQQVPAGTFHCVVTNPPYVAEGEDTSPETEFEPQTALFAGVEGLDDYRAILAELPDRLVQKGLFLGEHGYLQGNALLCLVEEVASEYVSSSRIVKDLAGLDRFLEILG